MKNADTIALVYAEINIQIVNVIYKYGNRCLEKHRIAMPFHRVSQSFHLLAFGADNILQNGYANAHQVMRQCRSSLCNQPSRVILFVGSA